MVTSAVSRRLKNLQTSSLGQISAFFVSGFTLYHLNLVTSPDRVYQISHKGQLIHIGHDTPPKVHLKFSQDTCGYLRYKSKSAMAACWFSRREVVKICSGASCHV